MYWVTVYLGNTPLLEAPPSSVQGTPSKRDFAAPFGAADHCDSAGPLFGPLSLQHLGDETNRNLSFLWRKFLGWKLYKWARQNVYISTIIKEWHTNRFIFGWRFYTTLLFLVDLWQSSHLIRATADQILVTSGCKVAALFGPWESSQNDPRSQAFDHWVCL